MADKYNKYRELISRIDLAIEGGFYLEATWIAYSILEDRLVSALKESGGGPPIRMLGPKIGEIKYRHTNSLKMRQAFFGDMIQRLSNWKDKRNDLMHALADERLDVPSIDAESKSVALEGRGLAREFSAACKRFKKLNAKASI
ncbi:hypothetical protein KQ940_09775 [Marinobacterium sp. D7]|uniref:hypothetical protein n=1 Tax=Marinobacterium ramblicola TaxID=2849041 RepID=UPI001C2D9260|nr:hypothetical protein [Marinobacterium ramblicola]MBV1788344.1 hypothetical protein [Marinobacterium ramblicola]